MNSIDYPSIKDEVLNEIALEKYGEKRPPKTYQDDSTTMDFKSLPIFDATQMEDDEGPGFSSPKATGILSNDGKERVTFGRDVIYGDKLILPVLGKQIHVGWIKDNRVFGLLAQDAQIVYDMARGTLLRVERPNPLCYTDHEWQVYTTSEDVRQYRILLPIVVWGEGKNKPLQLNEDGQALLRLICGGSNVDGGNKFKQAIQELIPGLVNDGVKWVQNNANKSMFRAHYPDGSITWIDFEGLLRCDGFVQTRSRHTD